MRSLALILALAVAPAASADVRDFTIDLDVAQATTAGPGATGSGSGTATLDTDTNLFSWNFSYSGLTGTEILAHFHLGAVGVPGGIELGLPGGSPKMGSSTVSDVQEADILANLWYANIHTDHSAGGEIRGQVVQAGGGVPMLPLPALALLALLLLGAALWLIRRRTFVDTKARV